MARRLDALFALPDLRDSPLIVVHVILSQRLCALFERAGRDPLPDLAVRLRSMRAARALAALGTTISTEWPERFVLRRPCCMAMSPDEALLALVARAASYGDRGGAHDAMRDLLPHDLRERIFHRMVEAIAAIRDIQPLSAD